MSSRRPPYGPAARADFTRTHGDAEPIIRCFKTWSARSWSSTWLRRTSASGRSSGCDELFLELRDADLHDFRDGSATREVYVYESAALGIRRNRDRLLLRLDEVVAVSRLDEVATS